MTLRARDLTIAGVSQSDINDKLQYIATITGNLDENGNIPVENVTGQVVTAPSGTTPSHVAVFTDTHGTQIHDSGVPMPVDTPATANKFFTAFIATTGAFTVAQPSAANLSDGTTGTGGAVVLATKPVLATPIVGGLRIIGRTSTTADPTTTEYPLNQDAGVHKNTTSGNVYFSYNDGGTIKKVQLT